MTYNVRTIEANNFYLKSGRYSKPQNFLKQASNVMFDVQQAIREVSNSTHEIPLMHYIIAFPNISDAEWHEQGYHETIDMDVLVFGEHIETPRLLKEKLDDNVAVIKDMANRSEAASYKGILATRAAFGSSFVLMSDEPEIRDIPEDSLGEMLDSQRRMYKQVSEEQEKLSRLPIKGFPRQIRGVAGSGKTIVEYGIPLS